MAPDDLIVKRIGTPWGGLAVCTHVGAVRTNNEDRYGASPNASLFAVADGMGGHPKGEVAAEIAVRAAVGQSMREGPYFAVGHAIFDAHEQVCRIPVAEDSLKPGCTLVVVAIKNGWAHIGSVGDSRVYYRSCQGQTELVTRDQSIDGRLTESIGTVARYPTPYRRNIGLLRGDLLLLCTDGLHGFVSDEKIAEALTEATRSREVALRRLVGLAFEAGAPDNITCMIARIDDLNGTYA